MTDDLHTHGDLDQEDTSDKRFLPQEEVLEGVPPLHLPIDDDTLIEFIDVYAKRSRDFFNKTKGLARKRKINKRYLFGRQLKNRRIKPYEKRYIDNIIREGEGILKPLLLSRLPDLIVKPGTKEEESKKVAENLTTVVNKTLTSQKMRKIMGLGFKHLPVYYTAVVKYRWDPSIKGIGDVVYENIHPDNILVDHTATKNNEHEMKVIIHYVEKSLKEWIMLFPSKKEVLLEEARKKASKGFSDESEEMMATNLKVSEVWFDWLGKVKPEGEEGEDKFETMSGVVWKLAKNILEKKRNPNWDHEGHDQVFLNNEPVPAELLPQLALTGFNQPGVEIKKVFNNFFDEPRKPFVFFGYEQWGEQPYDEISRIEDNILLQDNVDTRGMQITKMIDDGRGKHVFSELSGLRKKDVEEMDLSNPDKDLVVKGKLTDVYRFIQPELPSQEMFADFDRTRDRMLSKIHVSGPTRGEIQTSVATTNQIARESDFNVADDMAEETINDVALHLAEAHLHMVKLRYTPEHFEKLIGEEGDETEFKFTNDAIEDGMEVEIFASGVDKLKAERSAKEEAQLQLVDPINYYKDTGRSDPKLRAEMLFLSQANPELYFKKFIRGEDIPDIAEQIKLLNQQALGQVQGGQGAVNTNPQQPTPTDTTQVPTTPPGVMGRMKQGMSRLMGR